MGRERFGLPEMIVRGIFLLVGGTISKRAKFEVEELEMSEEIKRIECGVMLVASKDDTFIRYSHSVDIYTLLKQQSHRNRLEYTTGEHH